MHDALDPELLAADAARLARVALAEDGLGDITSEVAIADEMLGEASIEVRESLVLAGRSYADAVAERCGLPPIEWQGSDGDRLDGGSIAGTLRGPLRRLLRAERPLLNLMQRACGVATITRTHVDATAGTSCKVLHTRKTTPGLRMLEVSAVLAGGGHRHRIDLAETVMIKDNHWHALEMAGRSLNEALDAARARGVTALQVEVESAEQVRTALAAGATRILIDNQSPDVVAEWVRFARATRGTIEIEATGGITRDTVALYAATGVDFISLGALTHSAPAADLGMEVRRAG